MAYDKTLNKAQRRHIKNARKEFNGSGLRESAKYVTATLHHQNHKVTVEAEELVESGW